MGVEISPSLRLVCVPDDKDGSENATRALHAIRAPPIGIIAVRTYQMTAEIRTWGRKEWEREQIAAQSRGSVQGESRRTGSAGSLEETPSRAAGEIPD